MTDSFTSEEFYDHLLRTINPSAISAEGIREMAENLLVARAMIRAMTGELEALKNPEILESKYDALDNSTKVEMRGAMLGFFAHALSEFLDDDRAKNFVTMTLRDRHTGSEEFEVTIRRALGKSTSQVLGELRIENERLIGERDALLKRVEELEPRKGMTIIE